MKSNLKEFKSPLIEENIRLKEEAMMMKERILDQGNQIRHLEKLLKGSTVLITEPLIQWVELQLDDLRIKAAAFKSVDLPTLVMLLEIKEKLNDSRNEKKHSN